MDFVNAAPAPDAPAPMVQNAQFVTGKFGRGRRAQGDPYARTRNLTPSGLEGRLRAVIPMVMATPEYQVC